MAARIAGYLKQSSILFVTL